jgi:hypothetical protein
MSRRSGHVLRTVSLFPTHPVKRRQEVIPLFGLTARGQGSAGIAGRGQSSRQRHVRRCNRPVFCHDRRGLAHPGAARAACRSDTGDTNRVDLDRYLINQRVASLSSTSCQSLPPFTGRTTHV